MPSAHRHCGGFSSFSSDRPKPPLFSYHGPMNRVPMNRRNFFLRGATGLAALHNFPHHLFAGTTAKQATDRVKLGPRGVEVSRLAMGTGTNGVGGSSNQTKKLGVQGLADLFKFGYDHGLTFWDSADQYGTHLHMKA